MKNLFLLMLALITWYKVVAAKIPVTNVDADHPFIKYTGRTDRSDPKAVRYAWPGVAITARFEGRVCNLRLKDLAAGGENDISFHNYYNVIIDGKAPVVLMGDGLKELYMIDTLPPGTHTIEIFKRTEGLVGETVFLGFQLEKGKKLQPIPLGEVRLKIEFIGNSITCGYGIEGKDANCKFSAETENNYLAYGALTASKLQAEYSAVAFSGKGIYRNYDNTTTETMVDLYDRSLPFNKDKKWDFTQWTPDIVVVNLGTNDFAHQNPDSAIWVNHYLMFLKKIRSYYPEAAIICCVGPMMNDSWPAGQFALSKIKNFLASVVATAHEAGDKKVHLYFFTPQKGRYGCDWHPGLSTHEKMSEELKEFIEEKKLR